MISNRIQNKIFLGVFIMETHKACSFFGHRDVKETANLKARLKSVIVKLIESENVNVFLFGSRSTFDLLCHNIVTNLKTRYPQIQRRAYTCRSETCTLEKERAYWEEIYSHVKKHPVTLLGVEEEIEHKTKWTSGKAQYVERNQAMINDSDFCVFYYDKNYVPLSKSKSGTKIAYEYALRKKKNIINLFK